MPFKRLSKFLFALSAAVVLTATSAGAHSGHTFNYSVSSTATNAYANTTSAITFGAYEATDMTIDLEAGMKLAHDDQHGTEVTPNPNDEEEIGTGTAYASWIFYLCGNQTVNLTITWEEDMAGAPVGAVAHYVMRNSIGFDTDIWVIEENDATDDYKMTMNLDETRTCSTQPSNANASISTHGTTASGGHPYQNPSSNGCYTVTASFNDTATPSVNHTGSDDQPIGSGTCPG